jgi:phosphoglycolate phosphatase
MTHLLKSIKEQGLKLIVATSKPTVFAEQILKYFKIETYFEAVIGSHLDGTRTSKAEIIQYILDSLKEYKREEFNDWGSKARYYWCQHDWY